VNDIEKLEADAIDDAYRDLVATLAREYMGLTLIEYSVKDEAYFVKQLKRAREAYAATRKLMKEQ
jgi:hypothetical protein